MVPAILAFVLISAGVCASPISVTQAAAAPETMSASSEPETGELAANCGVLCVYVALRVNGVDCTLGDIASQFRLVHDSYTSLADCKRSLEKYGFIARAYDLSDMSTILQLPAQAILFVRNPPSSAMENHFYLLVRTSASLRSVCYCTPGSYVCDRLDRLQESWGGKCLVFTKDASAIERWEQAIQEPHFAILKMSPPWRYAWIVVGILLCGIILFSGLGKRRVSHADTKNIGESS